MAIYHLGAKVISRGAGRSACAASAYLSCSQILNDYDGIQHDYTRKSGLVWQAVFLPEFAPQEWSDRAVLWNAVEANEKTKNSRLAREFVVALPIELGKDQWTELLIEYIQSNFVAEGMCADVAIHDTDGLNPHAHIMITVRPLDEGGLSSEVQQFVGKDFKRRFPAQALARTTIQFIRKQYEKRWGKRNLVGVLGNVLTQQTVCVFIGTSLPGSMRICEIEDCIWDLFRNIGMAGKLKSPIQSNRVQLSFGQSAQHGDHDLCDFVWFPAVADTGQQVAGPAIHECDYIKLVETAVYKIPFKMAELTSAVCCPGPLFDRLMHKNGWFSRFFHSTPPFASQIFLHWVTAVPVPSCSLRLHIPILQCAVDGGITHLPFSSFECQTLCDLFRRPLLLRQ